MEHLNSVHSKIEFTVENEAGGTLPFLDVLVMRMNDGSLRHTVYRKPTHTDRYLKADSHHHPQHLSSVPRSLINRALRLCHPDYIDSELDHVREVLSSNGYEWKQSLRIANSSNKQKPHTVERRPIYLPFVKGVTDKIGFLLSRKFNIKTIFRPHTQIKRWLRSPKDKERLSGPGVYEIPCECGKSYIGETQRHVSTRVTEHIRSVKNRNTLQSAIAEHSLDSDANHYIRFDKAAVLAREKFFVP
ncbi:hypothetical protein NE865_01063 [Phthorimaea operculella]|nr:hypothetical protein NE865_01063 [Phthorimaea operculella]